MTRKLLLLLSVAATLSSCNWMDDIPDTELASLYRQRIAGSPYVLYDFVYPGAFVTTSDFEGVTILDSTVAFARSRIERLPSAYFAAKPVAGNLQLVDIDFGQFPRTPKDTLLTPRRRYDQQFNSVPFHVTEYQDTYGSATQDTGLMEYEFGQMKETADSLVFYQVTKKFGGRNFPTTVAFPKGNIRVVDSTHQHIQYIEVEQLVIKHGAIYKPTAPLKLVHNQPVVGWASYWFYPRTAMSSRALTDYGIWKRIK
jgi:hypothetical protein